MRTENPEGPIATPAVPGTAHTDTLFSPRTYTRRQFP